MGGVGGRVGGGVGGGSMSSFPHNFSFRSLKQEDQGSRLAWAV